MEQDLADMQHDTAHDTAHDDAALEQTEFVDELLIEEISIDGMCGVY